MCRVTYDIGTASSPSSRLHLHDIYASRVMSTIAGGLGHGNRDDRPTSCRSFRLVSVIGRHGSQRDASSTRRLDSFRKCRDSAGLESESGASDRSLAGRSGPGAQASSKACRQTDGDTPRVGQTSSRRFAIFYEEVSFNGCCTCCTRYTCCPSTAVDFCDTHEGIDERLTWCKRDVHPYRSFHAGGK